MNRSAALVMAIFLSIPATASAGPRRHDCDRLAASPNDDDALAPAVGPEEMNVEGAIQACRAALHEFPNTPRFEAQLANALFVARRYEEAVEWFRKAAGHGYAFGMYSMGSMHRSGEGLPEDDDETALWFRRAAEQGNAMAAYGMGWMHQEGAGCRRTMLRRWPGTVRRPSRETRGPSTPWAGCTRRAAGCRGTRRKPSSDIARQPVRGIRWRSLPWRRSAAGRAIRECRLLRASRLTFKRRRRDDNHILFDDRLNRKVRLLSTAERKCLGVA
jgi:hypothetical protein